MEQKIDRQKWVKKTDQKKMDPKNEPKKTRLTKRKKKYFSRNFKKFV